MSFRSRANPDQRRRRVLLDETRSEPAATVDSPRIVRRDRPYGDDALAEAQLRVTDLLPGTWRSVIVTATLLALVAGGIAALDYFRGDWAAKVPDLPLQSLSANRFGSLGRLFITFNCLLATAASGLIFAIRRRRLDDLRGTYQTWIWTTSLGTFLVFLSTVDVSPLIVFGIQKIPHVPVLSPRVYLWGVFATLYAPLILRLLVEMRRLRAAQLLLVTAAALACGAELLQLFSLPSRLATFLPAAITSTAAVSLSAAIMSYGCFVTRDARGAYSDPARRKRKRKKPPVEMSADDDQSPTKSSANPTPAVQAMKPTVLGAALGAARSKDSSDDRSGGGPLSRDNRKQLRRSA